MRSTGCELPSLDALGRDLLAVPIWRRAVSLAAPFVLTALFFILAAQGKWIAAASGSDVRARGAEAGEAFLLR